MPEGGQEGRKKGRDLFVEDGVSEGAVGLSLDELPSVVVELDQALEDGGGLLPGDAEELHGLHGPPCPHVAVTSGRTHLRSGPIRSDSQRHRHC